MKQDKTKEMSNFSKNELNFGKFKKLIQLFCIAFF